MQLKGIKISRFYHEPSSVKRLKGVFDTYYLALCFFANKILENRTTAEDIVTDVFIKLWEKDPTFESYKAPRALLYTAVRNACFDCIKKRRNDFAKQIAHSYILRNESEDFILNEITRAEVLREVYSELENLPEQCRKVMDLHFREGLDHKAIAQQLGITVSTVKNHKARGLQILKRKLGISFLVFCFFFG